MPLYEYLFKVISSMFAKVVGCHILGNVAEDMTKWDKGRQVSQKMTKKVGHPL